MGIKKRILHVSLIKNKLDDHKNIGQAKTCLLLAQPPSLNKVSDFTLLTRNVDIYNYVWTCGFSIAIKLSNHGN